jgi:hypothetical protein
MDGKANKRAKKKKKSQKQLKMKTNKNSTDGHTRQQPCQHGHAACCAESSNLWSIQLT